ncbi:alpha/beta hydrolase [Aureibaculum sp. 2210JD6-5]|uniref:alpha/beta hydrolase n=1 Tax=Aureibaculum sp. 2210JD6-5 TaxID=3103957 RepID=UPI002AAD7796|nr:alpha/beta hydrolase [Aureibaculum sp. 2210JD6-5]MDY7396096.1 alpha/beta hydrolase [Aureibaculum sp. 2210JD6-5]
MMQTKHLYFVPGLAASPDIFEYLNLPKDKYEIHHLDWLIPETKNENIQHYAKRMCKRITHNNPVLLGVSFGGVMVQEMSKIIPTEKVIIISSVKSKDELPKRFKLAKATKAYKLLPTKAVSNIDNLAKYAFGETVKKRIELYKKYLSMRDGNYLPWAIHNVINWQQEKPLPNTVHIHGNNDGVFPIKHVKNCKVIEGGTHTMILNKARPISKLLTEVI